MLLINIFEHVSFCNPQQTSTHISLLLLKLWHSYNILCFVFYKSLNKINISSVEVSIWSLSVSFRFWGHKWKGTHYSKISTILCILQHTLKHICYLHSIWNISHYVIHSKQDTFYYWYGNLNTPLYCIAQLTKETLVI